MINKPNFKNYFKSLVFRREPSAFSFKPSVFSFQLLVFSFLLLAIGFLFSAGSVHAQSTYFVHSDHLGSTSIITDENGIIVSEQSYYPYGSTRSRISNIEYPISEHQYTSQISDVDSTGLYYYNARYYDPTLAKFTQADIVSDQQNRYAYVANNPVNLTDPTGNMMDDGARTGGGGSSGSSKPYTGKVHIPDPQDFINNNSGDIDWNKYRELFAQFLFAFAINKNNDPLNSPQYSFWRDLVEGAPCTGCHVTHTFTQDGIPTNDEIDPNLIAYYNSLDDLAKLIYMYVLTFGAISHDFTYELVDEQLYWENVFNEALMSVEKELKTQDELVLVGSGREWIKRYLGKHSGMYYDNWGIYINNTGDYKNMTAVLHHEFMHYLSKTLNVPEGEMFAYGVVRSQPYPSISDKIIDNIYYRFFQLSLKFK